MLRVYITNDDSVCCICMYIVKIRRQYLETLELSSTKAIRY